MAHRDPTDNWAYLETAPDGTEFRITGQPDRFSGKIWNVFEIAVSEDEPIHTFNLKRDAIDWIRS